MLRKGIETNVISCQKLQSGRSSCYGTSYGMHFKVLHLLNSVQRAGDERPDLLGIHSSIFVPRQRKTEVAQYLSVHLYQRVLLRFRVQDSLSDVEEQRCDQRQAFSEWLVRLHCAMKQVIGTPGGKITR